MQSKIFKLLHIINEHHHNWHSEKSIWLKSSLLALTGSTIWEIASSDLIHAGIRIATFPLGAIALRITFLFLDKYLPLKQKENNDNNKKY